MDRPGRDRRGRRSIRPPRASGTGRRAMVEVFDARLLTQLGCAPPRQPPRRLSVEEQDEPVGVGQILPLGRELRRQAALPDGKRRSFVVPAGQRAVGRWVRRSRRFRDVDPARPIRRRPWRANAPPLAGRLPWPAIRDQRDTDGGQDCSDLAWTPTSVGAGRRSCRSRTDDLSTRGPGIKTRCFSGFGRERRDRVAAFTRSSEPQRRDATDVMQGLQIEEDAR
jgi:hypothetical protein